MKAISFFSYNRKMRTYSQIMKDLCVRYFHGNVKAQLGRIITEEDVAARRRKIAKYVF
ncbi:MAG: hypothetical protein FWE23_08475 [Chitinivibrionia bacterium]|nr:hypothetical protein [Chitinivibrionia bacterium]